MRCCWLVFVAAIGTSRVCHAWRREGDTRPNIVVFFPDTVQAESLSSYGHPFIQTPNTERLARSGVLFEQAHVQHTQCGPSRCALLTGRYMHTTGHRTQTHLIKPWEQNAFALLKKQGYTTINLGKNDILAAGAFNESLTFWEGDTGVSQGGNQYGYGEPGYFSFLNKAGSAKGNNSNANGDLKAAELTARFLRSDPPEPLFIMLTGDGGHPPYSNPSDYMNLYNASQVAALTPLREVLPGSNKPPYVDPKVGIPSFRNLTTLNDTFFQEINAVYLGRISFVDSVLGVLMDGIDASPLSANTALFYSSDHGDFAGAFRCVEKYPCGLDDVLTRVPLIARVPGGVSNVRVPQPVMVFDLMPTILELAGVNLSTLDPIQGLSLMGQLTGRAPNGTHKYVYSEGGYSPGTMEVEPLDPAQAKEYATPTDMYYPRGQEELLPSHCSRAVMQRNATAKLVYRTVGVSELYDLVSDPRELMNVWGTPAYASLQREMLDDLLAWFLVTSDVTPRADDDRNFPPKPVPPFPWPPAAP